MPRHAIKTLVNIAQMKRKPTASDGSLLMLKLMQNQVCKCTTKKVKRFVRQLRFSWSKNYFFIFGSSGFRKVLICQVELIFSWAIDCKVLPGPSAFAP